MCNLEINSRFKKNDRVELSKTSYLKYWQNHNAISGIVLRVLDHVHNRFVPEYEIKTSEGILIVPEYSIERTQGPSKRLSEKFFATLENETPVDVLLF